MCLIHLLLLYQLRRKGESFSLFRSYPLHSLKMPICASSGDRSSLLNLDLNVLKLTKQPYLIWSIFEIFFMSSFIKLPSMECMNKCKIVEGHMTLPKASCGPINSILCSFLMIASCCSFKDFHIYIRGHLKWTKFCSLLKTYMHNTCLFKCVPARMRILLSMFFFFSKMCSF